MATTTVFTPDYTAALEGAVYYVRADAGYLRISGADRVDFLNRQTTNDVRSLRPDRVVATVLTSPTARILDVLTLADEENGIGAITLDGYGAATARFLRGKIFFMDKVSVGDAGETVMQCDVDGPLAAAVLEALGVKAAPEPGAVLPTDFAGSSLRVIGRCGLSGDGFRLLVPSDNGEALVAALVAGGAEPLASATYEILRVEAGIAESGHELTEEYTPLEAGLVDAVSETKGCYTGQEIIARQLTYDKVTRHLVGLRSTVEMQADAGVSVDGKAVGVVTSAVLSPRFGPLALAYLKRPYNEPGSEVVVAGPEPIQASVFAFPLT